jgi:5-hydroxyisourate hydrolase
MSGITTHVLDTGRGRPAAGVPVLLEREEAPGAWTPVSTGTTDANGRLASLLTTVPGGGTFRLTFETGAYFEAAGVAAFYPRVVVTFHTTDADEHYHVPLLLSAFGYSTYRGS